MYPSACHFVLNTFMIEKTISENHLHSRSNAFDIREARLKKELHNFTVTSTLIAIVRKNRVSFLLYELRLKIILLFNLDLI